MPDYELYNGTLTGEEIDGLPNSIAIVANKNTHIAIYSGQYVYVKNHNQLASGLYKAISNISANGTLSSSNLSAVKNANSQWIGAANELKSEMAAGLAEKAPAGYGIGEDSARLLTSSDDLNTIPYGGLYRWSGGSIPSNSPTSGAGYIFNMPFNASHAQVQLLFDFSTGALKYRYYSGGWQAWKTITAT